MRAVIGVDSSKKTSAAVVQIGLLYHLNEVVLVHGAQVETTQGYDELRQALMESGRQALEEARALLPAETPSIRSMCEVQNPASLVIDCAANIKADIIVMGTRDLSQVARAFMGSVSSRVLTYSTVSTLIVKADARPVSRVLMAVEGPEDAARLSTWLTAHPFKSPVTVTILSVISSPHMASEHEMVKPSAASEQSKRQAEEVVNDAAKALAGPHFTVSTDVIVGDPVKTICEVGKNHDLIVVSSHGRKGLSRFFMGSVSEAVVHQADCSVLVVR
jgi:nucleotide-binding universal stress UspA family protein